MDELLAGKRCETCGEPATCGVVDYVRGGWALDPMTGDSFHPRFSGEHSVHWFCEFHERAGKVYAKGRK